MANYSQLKAAIADVIKTNGAQAITGQVLQDVLNSMVSVIGANYTFAGVATPSTNPGTPDQNVVYMAFEEGTYVNFNSTELPAGISLLMWNGSWNSQTFFTVDEEPIEGSNNLVKSGGVYKVIDEQSLQIAIGKFRTGVPIEFTSTYISKNFNIISGKRVTAPITDDYYLKNISDYIQDNNNNRYTVIDFPVDPKEVSYIELNLTRFSSNLCTAFIVDEDGYIISAAARISTKYVQNLLVPDNASKIYYSTYSDTNFLLTFYPNGTNDVLLNITDDSSSQGCSVQVFSDVNAFKKRNNIGRNVFEKINTTSNLNDQWYMIPVSGYQRVLLKTIRTAADWGFAVLDGNCNVIDVPTNPTGHGYDFVYDIPKDAKYIILMYISDKLPYQIKIYKEKENICYGDSLISFKEGTINGSGLFVEKESGGIYVSNPITLSKGFYLKLQDGYTLNSVYIYDLNGNVVGKDYIPPVINYDTAPYGYYAGPYYYCDYTMLSTLHFLPQYAMRIVVNGNGDGQNIVKAFELIEDNPSLVKVMPEQSLIEPYQIMKKRLYRLFNGWWKAMEDIFPATPNTIVTINYIYEFFKKNNGRTGIPYSEASEYSKYVGQNVSFITFFTSILNKRSVMYTERINTSEEGYENGNVSAYGIQYAGLSQLFASSYYGTVCTGLTAYVAGMKNLYISNDYHNVPSSIGLTKINNPRADSVNVMDFIWSSGHCAIISDIYKDRNGNVKYIAIAEQTKPTPYITLYSPSEFEFRLSRTSAEVYRYNKWNELVDDEQITPFIQFAPSEYPSKLSIDADITTFAGEYPVFTTMPDNDADNNNKAFLNIHRGGLYTKIQIYNEGDNELTSPIEYSLSDSNAWISQSTIYTEDAADKEDWIVFDLKKITNLLGTGKYKARVSNSDGTVVSGFTHWQMIELTLNVTVNDSSIVCDYSASDGVPYLIRKEKKNGMYHNGTHYGYHVITTGEESPLTLQWSDFDTYNYIKLYVRSEYGTVVIRKKIQNG